MEKNKLIKLASQIWKQYEKEVRANRGVVTCAAAGYARELQIIQGTLKSEYGYTLNLYAM